MSVSEKILDAIELLSTNYIEKAGYDKTIQAQIISCEDATIGKYKCRYQDAIIYAYNNALDIVYNNGSYVYILVPSGDMKKEKTILGTTKKLGINYISQAEGDQAYNFIGNNCITLNDNNIFYLNTINKDYKYVLYEYGRNLNDIEFDEESLNQYIKNSSSLIIGAIFKTTIPLERQSRGHYGITYHLRFLDNTSNKEVIRSYTIDEDNMVDNPYRLAYKTRQYQIFNIDGDNFIRVESIEIFNKDFPYATGLDTGNRLSSGDIEITNLEFNGAERMLEEEIDGVAISFYTPQGTFFTNSSTSASYKTITAQVKIKGKLASSAQSIPFYWGIENVGISTNSEYYNKYLGKGWKCLNDKNIITSSQTTENAVVEWVPGKDTYIFNFNMATAKDNKLKVAIVYNNNVITKEINIQNLKSEIPILTIESDSGTKFYYDIGHPTLTCKINNEEYSNYKYYWAYEDNSGIFNELSTTTVENNRYASAVTALNNLKTEIANGTKFINAESQNLETLENTIKEFDFIQRVDGNKIYNVQINNITSFNIFKCSVYTNEDIYLGTTSITLINSLDGENLSYSLVINNGSAVFQYNENGVAPTSKSLDVQQEIQELSFTIYDDSGNPIDSNLLSNTNNCQIQWAFPIKETMLVDLAENGSNSGMDEEENYRYYKNKMNLIYGIAQRYDIKKQRNQIKLTVNYKDISLTAETDFTFAKQGEPGTNGTEYLVKLVPNTNMSNPPLWPMITKAGDDYILNYGLGSSTAEETTINIENSYQLFKAQLWHSGQLVWEGFSAATTPIDGTTQPSSINWGILSNKYNSSTTDPSAFEISNASTGNIKYTGDHLATALRTPLANIIKCSITWQNKTYYGTIPVITAWTLNNNYRIKLKDYTGFRYVIYTSDGVLPQYDNSHPFEFICMERINDIWEDISLVAGNHSIRYDPIVIGNYRSTKTGSAINSNLLEILTNDIYREGCEKNQWRIRPASKYDGVSVTNAVCCSCIKVNTTVGRIHIPIHFLLNKYGMANINEWDGNSVQIDDQGGFILAPQMGAGHKENDNSFTGVLMGEVRLPGKNTPQIGLLGFDEGTRSFFFNSQNGAALLGKAGTGQITIDPSSNKAMLYSSNFWKNYNTDGDNDGLPTSYTYRNNQYQSSGNCNNAGLLIDFTTPEIFFGTGNFYVTSQGYLHAAAGGDIGGWKLDTHSLYSNVTAANGRITIDAGTYNSTNNTVTGPGKIYSHSHSSLTNTDTGFYLSYDGLSIGSKLKISNSGIMYIGNNAVSKGGTEDGNYWTINGNSSRSYISYGGSTFFSEAVDDDGTATKVYLGTDGISLGSRFSVNSMGELKSYSGNIGGWDINIASLSKISEITIIDGDLEYVDTYYVSLDSFINGPETSVFEVALNGLQMAYIKAGGAAHFAQIEGSITFLGYAFFQDQVIIDYSSKLTVNGTANFKGTTDFRGTTNFYNVVGFHSALWVSSYQITATNSSLYVGNIYINSTAVYPSSSSISLGTASSPWSMVYSDQGYTQTSDKRKKHDIKSLTPQASAFILNLNPVSYKMNNGTSGRRHYGLIAQEVLDVMNEFNIDTKDFGGYVASIDDETHEENYGLRYEEFIAPMIYTIQELNNRLKRLEKIF